MSLHQCNDLGWEEQVRWVPKVTQIIFSLEGQSRPSIIF